MVSLAHVCLTGFRWVGYIGIHSEPHARGPQAPPVPPVSKACEVGGTGGARGHEPPILNSVKHTWAVSFIVCENIPDCFRSRCRRCMSTIDQCNDHHSQIGPSDKPVVLEVDCMQPALLLTHMTSINLFIQTC